MNSIACVRCRGDLKTTCSIDAYYITIFNHLLNNIVGIIMDISTILFICILIWFFCIRAYTYRPIKHIDRRNNSAEPHLAYHAQDIILPMLRGWYIKIYVTVLNSMFGHFIFSHTITNISKLKSLRQIRFEEPPTFYPYVPPQDVKNYPPKCLTHVDSLGTFETTQVQNGAPSGDNFKPLSISDFITAYESGTITPSQVAENVLQALKQNDVMDINAMTACDEDNVRMMANASTRRYQMNQPLSPIDGIPITIKDEIKVAGYKCRYGTQFMGDTDEKYDAALVAKLRSKGVIIIGISNMHELGNGTTGSNPGKMHGCARNPYNRKHYAGGSSSGCASANAMGLAVFGLGTDGGGSVRIPSAFNGLVGLKATYGRISCDNIHLLAYAVGHIGPLCNNVKDCAQIYSILSEVECRESPIPQPPTAILPDFSSSIRGLKIGVDKKYNEHCDLDIHNACQRTLNFLEDRGCHVEGINIPESHEARIAHIITILSEMNTASRYHLHQNFNELTWESKAVLGMMHSVSAFDYIQANRQRTRCIQFFKELFEDVDVIITPSTAASAPPIVPEELQTGSICTPRDLKSMRYVFYGNLAGIPCITVPVGHDSNGLPIAVQVMGAWWREDLILRVAAEIEKLPIIRKKPDVYYNILQSTDEKS